MATAFKNRQFQLIFVILFLAVTTTAAYWQLKKNEFVHFDDDRYITGNLHVRSGLNVENIKWAFGISNKDTGHWHPLVWICLMYDYEFFGLNPIGYHLVNLLLHIANTILLFFLLNTTTGNLWQSAFVASLFALHPMNVESVAWAAERKNVLSSFFWMLTILAYVKYCRQPGLKRYSLVFISFAIGLMAKPILMTLPFILLLLDYWPLKRWVIEHPEISTEDRDVRNPSSLYQTTSGKRLLLEKAPLLILSVLSVLITLISVEYPSGILQQQASLTNRIANAIVSYVAYIMKMLWPSKLAVYYPLKSAYPVWQVVGAALLLTGISIFVIREARRRPWLLIGWLWYLGVLLPAIGLVRAGLWPAMADRYAYLPFIGLFIMIAWEISVHIAQWRHKEIILSSAVAAALVALIVCTWHQVSYWKNGYSLFEHAIRVTENNVPMYDNLGFYFFQRGDFNKALSYYSEALNIQPNNYNILTNVGLIYKKQGKPAEAVVCYRNALQIKPNYVIARLNLASLLIDQGRFNEAIEHYASVLRVEPGNIAAHMHLGIALAHQSNSMEASKHFSEVLRLKPDDNTASIAHSNLGLSLANLGRIEEASLHYFEALRLEPNNPYAQKNLGLLLAQMGRLEEAISHLKEAIRINPDDMDARINLERLLKGIGKK